MESEKDREMDEMNKLNWNGFRMLRKRRKAVAIEEIG